MQGKDNNQLSDQTDYQTVNAINKERKLAAIRSNILVMPSEKALDVILDSSFPATLIQSFPEQDLHFLMHHIGEEDFLPVLSLASSQQWEYILDVEVWNNDRVNLSQMTRNIALLYKADPQRFVRWAVKEKTEFLEYYLFRNMEIRIREHDQDPSDFGDEFVSIDDVFYFRVLKNHEAGLISSESGFDNSETGDEYLIDSKETESSENEIGTPGEAAINSSEAENEIDTEEEEGQLSPGSTEVLITDMLNTLVDMDISVFQGVLLETSSVIPAETEEEEFRLRNVRLAEKGFLPPHEAVAIYQPLKIKDLKKRPSIFLKKSFLASDLPLPPTYPSLMIKKSLVDDRSTKEGLSMIQNASAMWQSQMVEQKNLFADALNLLDKDENIALNMQSEFAFMVNSIASADREAVRSREALEKIVEKAACYLSLGIEMIHAQIDAGFIATGKGKKTDVGETLADEKKKVSSSDSRVIFGREINLTPEMGASILRGYALKDIFRVGSGGGMALKKRVQDWYVDSHIAKLGLSLTFLGESWLGVIGGLLLDRPLFFANHAISPFYTKATLYRPFISIGEIEQTMDALEAIVQLDKMVERLDLDPAFCLSREFLTWKAVFLTLWAMNRLESEIGFTGDENTSVEYCIPLSRFKPFFIELFGLGKIELGVGKQSGSRAKSDLGGKSGIRGKIDQTVRDDFFNWLSESAAMSGNTVSATVRKMFEDVFDELEDEYGSISPEDIEPELISHFILSNG
ncbi:MAG: hypothetical protein HQK65_14870 [Desulfamplus sp.]|nr:hypothetical protein [Desulfamplus sp.]